MSRYTSLDYITLELSVVFGEAFCHNNHTFFLVFFSPMPPTIHRYVPSEASELPEARIEAQDPDYIPPLREFLTFYGCDVAVNRPTRTDPLYWLVIGDADYVKTIIDRTRSLQAKTLVIVYEGTFDNISFLPPRAKIIYIDPVSLSPQLVRDIFSFFFTGVDRMRNIRKTHHVVRRPTPVASLASRGEPPKESSAAARRNDKERIAQTITQVFRGTPEPPAGRQRGQPRKGSLVWVVGVVFLLVAIPVVLYILSLATSVAALFISAQLLASDRLGAAVRLASYADKSTAAAASLVRGASPVLGFGVGGTFLQQQDSISSLLKEGATSIRAVAGIMTSGTKVASELLAADGSQVGLADVLTLRADVTQVSQHLSLFQAKLATLLSSGRFPFGHPVVVKLGQQKMEELAQLRKRVGYAENFLTLYPHLAGFRKKQTYLVLLQNNMELRPTGGFIGSIILLAFQDGKLIERTVHDVYEVDGQLKGHVDPPVPIREILGQEHWYLRDSNWDPDFSVSGVVAAWFYEKITGTAVDGVIGISLPLVTDLLRLVGPVELSDFNERVTADNFFAKSLLYTQVDFFPGSTQKKDFLGSLATSLILQLTTGRQRSSVALLAAFARSLEARDIQFYFPDPELEELVSRWSWAGKMTPANGCPPTDTAGGCFSDSLALVEANLGVNKANAFVSREGLSYVTIEEDGIVRYVLRLRFINESDGSVSIGGGAYQTYLRLFWSGDITDLTVSLDGVAVPFRDLPQREASLPYAVREAAGSRVVVGVAMSVPPKERRELTVVYQRKDPLVFDATTTYQVTMRKQAGIPKIPWRIVVTYPVNWEASANALAKRGELEYNTTLTKDAYLRVRFEK